MARPELAFHFVAADYLRYALPPEACVWTTVDAGDVKLSAKKAADRKRLGWAKGWPDIQVLHRGRFIGLELKAPKGVVRQSQTDMGLAIIEAGGHWASCRSIEDIEAVLRSQGVPLRATAGTKFEPRRQA